MTRKEDILNVGKKRERKNEQHNPMKTGGFSGAPEGKVIPSPLVTNVVLLLNPQAHGERREGGGGNEIHAPCACG